MGSVEQCNHCRPALEVLKIRADNDEVEPLNREFAMTIVRYLLSLTDHKACRCLLKISDACVAMHQVILDLVELSSSLMETLIDDLGQIADMEGSNIAGLSSSGDKEADSGGGGEECSLSCDESESMDLDTSSSLLVPPSSGEVRGFTLDDRKELFHLLPYLFTNEFAFYALYQKYHGAVQDRRLTAEKERYADNYFDISGRTPPFILTLASVRENGLLDRLLACFMDAKPGVLSIQLAFKLIQILAMLKRPANEHTSFNKIYPARSAALKFVCDLADEQSESLRDPFMRSCAEQLWNMGRDYLEETYTMDALGLDLIVKHFHSPYLAPRLTALTQLNMYINACTDILNSDSPTSGEDLVNSFTEYLSVNKVLQLLFGPNSHVELLKQCPNLLNFLALYEKISNEDMDRIWSAAQMKHCGRQVFELLTVVIKGMDPQLLLHLYSLLKGVKLSDHSEMTLQLTAFVTKMLWSYGLCRASFSIVPPNQQPQSQHLAIPRPSNDAVPKSTPPIWSGPQNDRNDNNVVEPPPAGAKFEIGLELSSGGDSTQASTTCGEEVIAVDATAGSESLLLAADDSHTSIAHQHKLGTVSDGKVLGKRAQAYAVAAADDEEEGRGGGKKKEGVHDDDGGDGDGRDHADAEEVEDRSALVHREPLQKRARVVEIPEEDAVSADGPRILVGSSRLDQQQQQQQHLPLKVKVQGILGLSHDSPGDSSTTESSSSGDGDGEDGGNGGDDDDQDDDGASSVSSDDRRLDANQRRHVSRLMQHAKFPCSPVRPEFSNRGGMLAHSGGNFGWIRRPDSSSGLLETLVKQKDLTNQRGFNDSDSDISSDAATSSDRMNDVDDEDDEIAVATGGESGVESKLLSFMEHLQQPHHHHNHHHRHRPSHSSPVGLEELDESHDRQISSQHHQALVSAAALQLQQHNRNILSHMAPHAKIFWQSKYKELDESELAVFDLSLVCNPGHTLLWDLIVDDGVDQPDLPSIIPSSPMEESPQAQISTIQHSATAADRLSPDLHSCALHVLEEVLSWAPSIFIKKSFIRGCVERLRSHKSVPIVLRLLQKIMASFLPNWRGAASVVVGPLQLNLGGGSGGAGGGEDEGTNPVIWAQNELDLLTAFFDDLTYFRRNQAAATIEAAGAGETRFSVERELRARVEFLEYVFSNQGTPINYQISGRQLDILWECLSIDARGEELLHKWLLDQLKSQSQHALNMELLHYVLVSKVVSFKPETLSDAGLAFLQAVLQETNGRSPSASGEAAVQVCLPLIWSAAMRNADATVSTMAMSFISNYYVHTGGSPQKELQFIDSCMSHLRFACESMTVESQLPSSLMCTHRAIMILRSHIDAFRRRHSFHLRMWELEGRGVKSHMQCVPHAALVESIPPIRLTLQAPGVEKKTIIEIAPTDLLGHVRAEVTYWWKNAKKTHISPEHSAASSSAGAHPTTPALGQQRARKIASSPCIGGGGVETTTTTTNIASGSKRPPTISVEPDVPRRPVNVTIPAGGGSGIGFIPFTPDLLNVCAAAASAQQQESSAAAFSSPEGEMRTSTAAPDPLQHHNGAQNPILGALLSTTTTTTGGAAASSIEEGQISGVGLDPCSQLRLLCGGRELTSDLDEKNVLEVGLRDGSIIHVQTGNNNGNNSTQHGVALLINSTTTRGNHSPGGGGGNVEMKDTTSRICRTAVPPDLSSIPMSLLSVPTNWQLLMDLIKLLIDRASFGPSELAVKCRSWSYRAWEVIQLLPTNPGCVGELQRVLDSNGSAEGAAEFESTWMRLFDSNNLHDFLYYMQCLQILTYKKDEFAAFGGIKHLLNVLINRSLFPKENGDWSEWEVECLTAILRVALNFAMQVKEPTTTTTESIHWKTTTAFRSIIHHQHHHHHARASKSASMAMIVPTLDMRKFDGIDKSQLIATIIDLIAEFCSERPTAHVCGLLSRVRGLQCAFQFLVALLLNDDKLRREFRFGGCDLNNAWLKRVLLDCQDPNLRREVSASLYRLCRGRIKDGSASGHVLTPRLTVSLLSLLKDAKDLPPFVTVNIGGEINASSGTAAAEADQKPPPPPPVSSNNNTDITTTNNNNDYNKEPYGLSPSSYFWLLTNLLESLLCQDGELPASQPQPPLPGSGSGGGSNNNSRNNKEKSDTERELANADFTVDLDAIAAEVAQFIIERPFYEWKLWSSWKQRPLGLETGSSKMIIRPDPVAVLVDQQPQQQQADSGLVGLLQTAISITKFNPMWKFSPDGQAFVHVVCDLIFALPSSKSGRHHPKCQSPQSRTAAYDLLVEISKGCDENFMLLYKKLLSQNSKESHEAYGWEYWPQDDRRAPCGYVGLMNLGATCYMASAMQQLYMIPRFRAAFLNARVAESTKHEEAFTEMQKMFAFLLESERKAFNPRAFCKAYQMNHQQLSPTEQKDMSEFFTDLITKLEEMSPDLKRVVKSLFCGIMSNNVVSLDCPHVSKTMEEFYTVRCQVADMKDLHDSLSELTIGDMLEGDNMYTCSQCNKKVRAEKRACFQKLPRILCFNTMRYTFNMITMMKEKVNTHFSFPYRLNMSAFMEENLLPSHASGEDTNDSTMWATKQNAQSNEYELIGVTVHTGTAEGGHYYSFIRERSELVSGASGAGSGGSPETDRWYSFNDADVRPWDPAQLAAECFGGELTRQQYDSVADKYMDLAFEKTNSAYMVLYERVPPPSTRTSSRSPDTKPSAAAAAESSSSSAKSSRHPHHHQQQMGCHSKLYHVELHPDIERWICEDNVRFIQDLMFFDHSYFNFVWQICSQVPSTLIERDPSEVTFLSARLSLSFVLETLLHSKEKSTISQWLELILKDLSGSLRACEWFLTRMAKNGDWPAEILMGCPSKSCREVFQKLCYHAILELHLKHEHLYLLPWTQERPEKYDAYDPNEVGNQSCVGRFIKRLLALLSAPQANVETRQLHEYFGLLLEFAKSRPTALTFLHLVGAIHSVCTFYTKRSTQDTACVESEEDASDEDAPSNLMSLVRASCGINMRPSVWYSSVLERLLKLVTLLLDSGRVPGADGFKLRQKDLQAIIGGKSFPFLMQMIRDVANPNLSGPLILSVCRGNTNLGKKIIEAIFDCLKRLREDNESYLNLLSYFVDIAEKPMLRAGVVVSGTAEAAAGVAASPDNSNSAAMAYVNLILERMWELADIKPVCALKWLERNVSNHRLLIFDALINNMKLWVERFLLASAPYQARLAAGELLLGLIPSSNIRSSLAAMAKVINVTPRPAISSEAAAVLHRVYDHLLWLLRHRAASYAMVEQHGTHRLVYFFQTMKALLISKDEKLMVVPFIGDIWNLFHGHMMEKPVKINANKQALLTFWYMACVDCPEMAQVSVKHPGVQQYFMYNYIHVADDDEDLTNNNKQMLHAFYGLMRLFCMHSHSFCEMVIRHDNMTFACQSVATKDAYKDAREEIFGAIEILCKQPIIKPPVLLEFKERIWSLFLTAVAKSRANFPLLLRFMKIAVETPQDKIILLQHHILPICSDAFHTLHKMHHEASGCNVLGDLSEILKRFCEILKFAARCLSSSSAVIVSKIPSPAAATAAVGQTSGAAASDAATQQQQQQTGEDALEDAMREVVLKAVGGWSNMTATLHRLLELLNSYIPQEIRKLSMDCIKEIVVLNETESLAAILPEIKRAHTHCRAATTIATSVGPYFPKRGGMAPFRRIHPPRPMFNMCLQPTQLEASKGVDPAYDQMLYEYFHPYHHMVDRLLRIAFNLGPDAVPPQLLAEVSCLLGCEGVPLHLALFPKLWLDLWQRLIAGKDLQNQVDCLYQCPMLKEYVEAVLVQEQHSLSNPPIVNFVKTFADKCQQSIPAEKIIIAIDNAIASMLDAAATLEVILVASSAPASALGRVFERLPVCFSRTRGALWALYFLYSPDKLPIELYKGPLHSRILAAWTKFASLCNEEKSSNEASTSTSTMSLCEDAGEDQKRSAEGTTSQSRYDIESKLRQCYSEFMTDNSDIVGTLLNRLEIPGLPIEIDDDDGSGEKE